MNQGHISSGEVVNLEMLKGDMQVDASYALVKTDDMEVIRMSLPEGKKVTEHSIEGEMSVLCLKGKTIFKVGEKKRTLTEGDWLYLRKKQVYSYSVEANTILLVTILFTKNSD